MTLKEKKKELKEALENAKPLDGVKITDNGFMCTVSSKTTADNGFVMFPGYYLPRMQARAVMQVVDSCSTEKDADAVVKEMIETRHVNGKETVPLNNNTIEILKNCEFA